jgi:hypothetical protein
MDIGNTVAALARDPNLMAWRDCGIAIAVFPNGRVMRVMKDKPYAWQPRTMDLIATDWQIGTLEHFMRKYATEGNQS